MKAKRGVVLVHLPPYGLGLRLHSSSTEVKTPTAPSSTLKRAFDFGGKINVTGCIDDIDAMVDAGKRTVAGVHPQEMAAEVIVMPRSRSCSIQSVTAAPSWTSPILWITPE